jgi:hypothetical protein
MERSIVQHYDQFGVHKHLQLSPILIKHHTITAQPPEKQPQLSSEKKSG